jgi:flagellar hook-length control protein FliK
MSTASISRSPYETAPPTRRDASRTRGTDEVFTLPAAEKREANDTAHRPRPRAEQGRGASETSARGRESAGGKEVTETSSPGGAEKPEAGGKTTEATKAGEALAEAGKQGGEAVAETAAPAEKPAVGEEMIVALPQPVPPVAPAEQAKPVLEAPLAGAAQPAPDAVATTAETPPEAAKPATGSSEIVTQFLALVATTQQPGTAAEAGDAADEEAGAVPNGKGETVGALPAAAAIAPAPVAPVKAEGEGSVGGEVVAGEAKVATKPTVAGTMLPAEAGKADPETADEAGTGQTSATIATAGAEGKHAERAGGAGQVPAATEAGKADAPQQAAPANVQAVPAAAPQVPARPELPLAPLDAAAQANAEAQAQANARAPVETTRPTPLHVVPVEIGARALAGNKRFDIRLDPAELGRVDVRLEISDKGEVSAKLTVDRVETLHLLQRDARTLERAFEQAGLKPSEGGVEMSLRDSSDQNSRQHRPDDEGARTRRTWVETAEEAMPVTEMAPLRRAARLGGVDLSI